MALVHSVLSSKYELKETIGSGGFAKVKLAYHYVTREKVAIKIIDKTSDEVKNELQRIYNEISVLKQLRHQNICQLYEVIETDTHVYLVMEYCADGELFDYIVSRTHLTESDARYYFRQILSAIAYTHRKGIVHRDLKPENLLLDEEQNCKLIDFGLCSQPMNGLDVTLMTCCGSPSYAAPEVITGKQYYGPAVDVWSLGVILYALLCGSLPFEDEHIGKLFKKIQRGSYEVPDWLSVESTDLLAQMMCVDPLKRTSIDELCRHQWVTYGYNDLPVQPNSRYECKELDVDSVFELAVYHGKSKARMTKAIEEWRFDHLTAFYLILLNRKERGLPIQLSNPALQLVSPTAQTRRPISVHLDQSLYEKGDLLSVPNSPICFSYSNKENVPNSPGFDLHSPTFAVPNPPRRNAINGPLSPSRSMDSQLGQQRQSVNIDGFASPAVSVTSRDDLDGDSLTRSPRTPRTPLTRTVFGSLERHMDRVRQLITPKRKGSTGCVSVQDDGTPTGALRKLSAKYNVTPYAEYTPESVLNRLVAALEHRCVRYKRRGYILRCHLCNDWGKTLLAFDLEVCLIAKQNQMVGVRRKRVKGDTWHYKRLCEDLLQLAQETASPAH